MVKFGALIFVLGLDKQNAINLQLLGGVWILQTFLAMVVGLYTRWLHRWALLAGWAVGMLYGTVAAYHQNSAATKHFGGSLATFPYTHTKVYIAFSALVLNIVVAVVLTLVLRAVKAPAGTDHTAAEDYYSESTAVPAGVARHRWRPAGTDDRAGRAVDGRGQLTPAARAILFGAVLQVAWSR